MKPGVAFEVLPEVPAEVRASRGRPRAAYVDAVLAGQVIFMPGVTQRSTSGRFQRATAAGYRVRTRVWTKDGIPGVVVWAEKL